MLSRPTIAILPLSILYFDIYVCYMFNKITYLLTYLNINANNDIALCMLARANVC